MKKSLKVLSIVLIAISILLTVCNSAFALTPAEISATSVDAGTMTTLAGKILGGLQIFGTIAAVLIIAILGIKYMTASPEGKADYKANMVPYIVGAVLVFGAPTIANLVYNTLK